MTRPHGFMSKTIRVVVALALCGTHIAWLMQADLLAADRTLGGSVLEIHHRDGKFVDPSNRNEAAIDEKPVYVWRKGDTLSLRIVDPNPLLFTYSVDVTATETADHKAAAEFAKTLSALVSTFTSVKTSGGPGNPTIIEGLNIETFQQNLANLDSYLSALPRRIEQSLGSDAEVATLKSDIGALPIAAVNSQLRDAFVKLRAIQIKCLSGQPLSTGSGISISCQDSLDGTKATLPAAAPAPVANAAGGPPRPAGNLPGAAVPAPVAAPAPAAPVKVDITSKISMAVDRFVSLATGLKDDTEKSLTVLTSFDLDVKALAHTMTLKCKDDDVCAYKLDDQTVTIKVAKSSKYESFLTDAVKTRRDALAKDYSLILRAHTAASIGVAPAFVILFHRNPTFSAVKKGDVFVIQSDDPQVTGYNVAAMLTITPKSWSEPTFGGQFQIGVSPTKDKIGFYLGAGVHVQEMFTFGGGFTLQQTNRLAGGLTVGQTIASQDLLKTETEYTPGFYFHITANLKK